MPRATSSFARPEAAGSLALVPGQPGRRLLQLRTRVAFARQFDELPIAFSGKPGVAGARRGERRAVGAAEAGRGVDCGRFEFLKRLRWLGSLAAAPAPTS